MNVLSPAPQYKVKLILSLFRQVDIEHAASMNVRKYKVNTGKQEPMYRNLLLTEKNVNTVVYTLRD
jgi:hypothetical protein